LRFVVAKLRREADRHMDSLPGLGKIVMEAPLDERIELLCS
jgi:hypothetical protein